MDTIGSVVTTIMPYSEDHSIDLGFICDAQVNAGAIVNLKAANAGVVEVANAVGDIPMVVSVGNKAANGRVTVKTPFVAVVKAVVDAGAGVAYGAMVYQTGITSGFKSKVATLAVTGYACGIALSAAADTAEITIGILRTPMFYNPATT